MTASFYADIAARLAAKLDWFTYFALFNNQFEKMESQEEQPFPNLSVFMEFISPTDIITLGYGTQLYDLTVRFHLYLISYELEDLDILTYKTQLNEAIHGYFPANSSSFTRINEAADQNHNGYFVWQLDYSVQIPDETASQMKNVINTPIDSIDVTAEIL